MMAGDKGERIGGGYVDVTADLSNFDAAMAALPKKAADKMGAAMQALQARAKQTKLELQVAYKAGDLEAQQRLIPIYEQLKAKIEAVRNAAINQTEAIRESARAANAAFAGQMAAAAAAKAASAAATQAGQATRSAGMNGAMGLMMMSQFIDDMQYGFKSVVNQIPQLGMAIGSAFGMSSEAAMKLGGAMGIAAVGVNLLINHWDELMDLMGMGKVLTEAEQMEKLGKATKLTADEQERLNRFKREEKIGKELEGKQSSGVEQTEDAIKDSFAEFGDEKMTGYSKIVNAVVAARRGRGEGAKMTPQEEAQLGAIYNDYGGTPYYKLKADEAQAKLNDEDVKRAQHTVDTAAFDPMRRKELIAELGADPGSPQYAVAMKLQEAGPEAQERQRNAAADAAVRTANEDMAAERKKAADALAAQQTEGLDEANRADYEKALEYRKNEDSRLAGAMKNSVGQKYLANPTMSDETLQGEVKAQMQKAGMAASDIAQAMKGTAEKIRKEMDEAVTKRALDRGINPGVAAQQLLKEANDQDQKQANRPKAEVLSTESYLNKVLVAGASRPNAAADKALVAQEGTAKATAKFADLAEKWEARGIKVQGNGGGATFQRGRNG